MKVFKVKEIVSGECFGEPFIVDHKISFFGEVDPSKGIIRGYDGSFKDKVLIIPGTRGSTVGSYVIYALKEYDTAPKCIIVGEAEPILIVGCILSNIPLLEVINFNDLVNYIRSINGYVVYRRDLGGLVVEERYSNSY